MTELPCEFIASQVYVPASCLLNLVIFKTGPSEMIRSTPEPVDDCIIGRPSLVQVYAIFCGLPSAFSETISGSPSTPVTASSLSLSKTGLSKSVGLRIKRCHISAKSLSSHKTWRVMVS